MKKLLFITLLLILQIPIRAFACEVCQNKQPKVLQGITHGTGPQGNLDYIIIWSAVIVVAITFFFSVKYLVRPREVESSHIKNIVLK